MYLLYGLWIVSPMLQVILIISIICKYIRSFCLSGTAVVALLVRGSTACSNLMNEPKCECTPESSSKSDSNDDPDRLDDKKKEEYMHVLYFGDSNVMLPQEVSAL